MNSTEAETKTRNFIKHKHTRAERIFFAKMYRENDSWILQGEVKFRRAYFFTTLRAFEAQVNTSTGEVTAYEETRLRNLEKPWRKETTEPADAVMGR
ncbi:MAG: hypothetical protein ACE14S_10805 [Candidatus Bathyarchaeia archaeon]